MSWPPLDVEGLFGDRVEVFENFFSVVLVEILDVMGLTGNVLHL